MGTDITQHRLISFPRIRFSDPRQDKRSWSAARNVSRKSQYKDVYRKTREILQRARIFKANCCLKVHNEDLNLASQRLTQVFGDNGDHFLF